MGQTKRILSIKVERITDETPDSSYLGEYARSPKGDYSIDRKHSLDCCLNNPRVNQPAIDQLERVHCYLEQERSHASDLYDRYGTMEASERYDAVDSAQDLITESQDSMAECDCEESGDWSHKELQYFNTSGNYTGEPVANIIAYTKQDYQRMEAYNNGDWQYLGIRVKAEIQIGDTCQNISSGGLWGVESDSEDSYLKEVEQEELSSLRQTLYDLGFSKRAIAAAVKAI